MILLIEAKIKTKTNYKKKLNTNLNETNINLGDHFIIEVVIFIISYSLYLVDRFHYLVDQFNTIYVINNKINKLIDEKLGFLYYNLHFSKF